MDKYEYFTKVYVFGKTGMKYTEIDHTLNEFGEQGWELVTVVRGDYGQFDYYFKRKKQ